jgi:hypothetical protein
VATYTPKRLGQAQPGTSYGNLYVAPADKSAIIKELVVCNPTAGTVALDVSFVASGGTAGVTNNVIANHVIGAYSTVIYTFAQVLAASGFVAAKASAAASLTVTVSGVEFA